MDEIVKIARKAAEKRGYAIFEDYEKYMEQRMLQEGLKPYTWGSPNIKLEIRKTLLEARWTPDIGHPETRYYPPSTEPLGMSNPR